MNANTGRRLSVVHPRHDEEVLGVFGWPVSFGDK
jgi:hypothetical protein